MTSNFNIRFAYEFLGKNGIDLEDRIQPAVFPWQENTLQKLVGILASPTLQIIQSLQCSQGNFPPINESFPMPVLSAISHSNFPSCFFTQRMYLQRESNSILYQVSVSFSSESTLSHDSLILCVTVCIREQRFVSKGLLWNGECYEFLCYVGLGSRTDQLCQSAMLPGCLDYP